MAKVVVPAKIQNLNDLFNLKQGIVSPDQVRSIDVTDALVDTELPHRHRPNDSSPNWAYSHFDLMAANTSLNCTNQARPATLTEIPERIL